MDATKAQNHYFSDRMHHHSYDDLNLMHSYGEYLEAKHQESLARKLHTTKVKMTVMQPNPQDHNSFLVFFQLQGFREYKDLLGRVSAVLICDDPVPKEMTESAQAGELGIHFVYLKLFFSDWNTRNKIGTADALREDRTIGDPEADDPEAERLRTLFLGRNYVGVKPVDIFAGLSDQELRDLAKDQTPSLANFLTGYCRELPYRFGVLIGAFGSGKTSAIKMVAQAVKKIRKRVLVVASGNPSADQVVLKVAADKSLKVVRLHNLGLEETTLSESFRNLAAVAEARVPWLSKENDSASDWTPSSDDGEIAYQYNTTMLRTYQSLYQQRDQADAPDGFRRVLLDNALWTKLLQYAVTLPGGQTTDPVTQTYFPEYYIDSQNQLLEKAGKCTFNMLVEIMAGLVVRDSDVVVCTTAQLGFSWMEKQRYHLAIADDASMPTAFECLQVVTKADSVIMSGDIQQHAPSIISPRYLNVFKAELAYPPLKRLIECNYGYYLLRESMRMTAGLKNLVDDVFYKGEFIDGPGTSLTDRPRTVAWLKLMEHTFPSLRKSPEGLAYPVLFNAWTTSKPEPGRGTSRWNPENIACAISYIRLLVNAKVFPLSDIGIITPFAAQVDAYLIVLRGLGMAEVDVRTVDGWIGDEKPCMIADLVVAKSDVGYYQAEVDVHRLCVLFTRQQAALAIVGDLFCTRALVEGEKKGNWAMKTSVNKHLKKVFEWMSSRGRTVDVQYFDEETLQLCRDFEVPKQEEQGVVKEGYR
ncbi:hypothetical protein Q9189_003307 [Teloschistes chrysophthalmus]